MLSAGESENSTVLPLLEGLVDKVNGEDVHLGIVTLEQVSPAYGGQDRESAPLLGFTNVL